MKRKNSARRALYIYSELWPIAVAARTHSHATVLTLITVVGTVTIVQTASGSRMIIWMEAIASNDWLAKFILPDMIRHTFVESSLPSETPTSEGD